MSQPDIPEDIFEKLDDNLANAPGAATEIGWEAWGEEKQAYYAQAKAALDSYYLHLALEAVGPHASICPCSIYYESNVNCDCGIAGFREALVSAFKGNHE